MPRYRTFQTSFTSGEFDQKLRDRTDTREFFEASQLMRNFTLLAQGGFTRRPGTFLLNSLDKGRLIPFLYSSDDGAIIHLKDGEYQMYNLLGQSISSSKSSPFLEEELFEVTYAQNGNSVILCHRNHEPQVLNRKVSNETFSMAGIAFDTDGQGYPAHPYSRRNKANLTKFTVGSLDYDVSTTLTSTQDYFEAGHVGSWVRLEEGVAQITAYTSATQVTIDQKQPPQRQTPYEALTTTDGSKKIAVFLARHSFKKGDTVNMKDYGDINGISASNINGARVITKVINRNTFQIEAAGGGTASGNGVGGGYNGIIEFQGPTPLMFEQSFSDLNGYPNAVCVHDQRLWFGGTIAEPDALWASAVGDYDNFDIATGDDNQSIGVNIDDSTVNEIRHLVSSRHLQVLTNEAEYFVPTGDTGIVTPSTFTIRKQTPYGSSRIKATLFDGATMFLQDSGRSLREFLYTDREFAYNARNIAVMAQHLLEDPIQMDAVYGGLIRPEQYVFLVNATGTITVLHSIRSEEIVGWAQWEAQGKFLSLCVVGERIFVLREHDSGQTYLEEIDMQFNYFMDGIIGFKTETPTNTWGPATEYANQEVAVTADGYFLGYTTVDGSGNFTTELDYTSCEIGHNFVARARTMQAAFTLPDGPMSGLPLRLTRAVVDFGSSNTIDVNDQALIIRQTEDTEPFNNPEPYDQKEEFWLNVISRAPAVDFVSDVPLETTVYSCLLEIAY